MIRGVINKSMPKDNINAGAGESEIRKQRRNKAKLIRLDDLIPKANVTGGRQVFLGTTTTPQQLTTNKKER
jgi:hypothetical protein